MQRIAAKEYASVCRQIREHDTGCEMPIPCKFFPRCSPTDGKPCKFAHVPDHLKSEHARLFKEVQDEDYGNRVRMYAQQHVFPALGMVPLMTGVPFCLAITYSLFGDEVYGTEHVRIPRSVAFSMDDNGESMAQYLDTLKMYARGLRIVAVRAAPLDTEEPDCADGGHIVHRTFVLAPSVRKMYCSMLESIGKYEDDTVAFPIPESVDEE
jgi:hypothetical protein